MKVELEILSNDKHVGAPVLIRMEMASLYGEKFFHESWEDVGAVIMCVDDDDEGAIVDYPGSVVHVKRENIKLKF